MGVNVNYSISCDICTETEQLFTFTKKDATEEAKRLGWKVGAKCICPSCQKESNKN